MSSSARPSRRPTSVAVARVHHRRAILGFLAIVLAVAPVVWAGPASAAFSTLVDEGGANDEPGQKDLTLQGVDRDTGPGTIGVLFNWDDNNFGPDGGNTGDGCSLFDSDGDGKADFALCVTADGTPSTLSDVVAYSCNDTRVDRCAGDSELPSIGSTLCEVDISNTDPFPTGDFSPADTRATCTIDLTIFGAGATLINTCSYPSTEPNSAPSDCVLVPRDAFLTVVKVANPSTSQQFPFTLTPAPGVTNPVFTATGSQTSGIIAIRSDISYALQEAVPTGWLLDSATCTGATGTGSSNGSLTGSTINGINASPDNQVTCTFTNSNVAPTITVTKTPTPAGVTAGGGEVVFSFVVENTSTPAEAVTLTTLTDSVFGDLLAGGNGTVTDTDCDTTSTAIPAGGTFTCSVTATVTPPHSNTVTAVVTDAGGVTGTDDDTASVVVNNAPVASVDKQASVSSLPAAGGVVTFTVEVSATDADAGDTVTLTVLDDDVFGDLLDAANTAVTDNTCPAQAGATLPVSCTFKATITTDHVNTVTATVSDGTDSDDASDDATVAVNDAPTVEVTKSASDTSLPAAGGTVTYTVSFTTADANGDPVTLVSLIDDEFGDLLDAGNTAVSNNTCPADAATGSCTFDAVIGADHTNIVTIVVTDGTDTGTDDSDAVTVTVNNAPVASVDKQASVSSLPAAGGVVTFTVEVSATDADAGDTVTLTVLDDDVFGDLLDAANTAVTDNTCPAQAGATLPVSCTFKATITTDHVNTVTATVSDGTDSDDASDDATVAVNDAPTVEVTKSASDTSLPAAGGTVTYTVSFTTADANGDPVTLVSLIDDEFGDLLDAGNTAVSNNTCPADAATGSCTFDAVIGADHTNIVTIVVTDGTDTGTDDSDAVTVTVNNAPVASVDKQASVSSLPAAGGVVTFTVEVSATDADAGDTVTLTVLDDDVFGDLLDAANTAVTDNTCPAQAGATLPVSCTFKATITTDHVNTVTATVSDGTDSDDASDDATVAVNDAPTVEVTKSASDTSLPAAGGTVTYTVSFTTADANGDPVTLVSLIDDEFGDLLDAGNTAVSNNTCPADAATGSCTFDAVIGADHTNIVTIVVTDGTDTGTDDSDAVTVTVNNAPVASVDKQASVSSLPAAGGVVTFTVEVSATDADAGDTVTLTVLDDDVFGDLLDAANTAVTDNTCPAQAGATLPVSCTFKATITTDHVNTVTATVSDGTDSDDASDDATVAVNDAPTVEVTKSASDTSLPAAGGTVTYTVSFTTADANGDPVTLVSLIDDEFGDLLDAGNTAVSNNTCPADAATGSCTFDAVIGADHTNIVTIVVTDGTDTGTDDSDAVTVTVNNAPVASVDKQASVSSLPAAGGVVTFTVEVSATDADAGDTVTLTVLDDDVFGDLLDAANTAVTDNTCPAQAGATLPVSCTFKATITTDHVNTVTATVSDGTDSDDATDDATVDVRPAIVIDVDKQADVTEVPTAGGDVTYTVVVTNDSVVDVTLTELFDTVNGVDTDLLDTGNELQGNTCNDTVGPITITANGGTFTCTFTLFVSGAPGSVHTDEVTAVAGVGPDSDTAVSPSVDVTIKTPPPPPPPPPSPSADLSVTKSVDPAEIDQGLTATFTIVVANDGPNSASSVTLTDPVPEGLEITDVSTTAGTCTTDGQDVTCTLGTLAATTSVTITIEVTGVEPGLYTNDATADSSTADPDSDNDTGSTDLVVIETDVAGECVEVIGGLTGIEGPTRIETAIEASQSIFCDGEAIAVVLTRSDLFPDAQAGTPLAIDKDAPMLLSEPASLNPMTETEILRVLQPGGTVYLLGGTAALSQAVEDRIIELGFTAIRYGGLNRFGTAAIIADQGLGNPGTLLAANGGDFPDSVMAGAASLAAGQGDMAAVILTSGTDVPPETAAYLATRTDNPTLIAIGGPAAAAFPEVEGIVGPSRFDTSVAVAERFFTDPVVAGLATGINFADALTGGAVIGRDDIGPGPMLLTNPDELPAVVGDYLAANTDSITGVAIFGGSAAISEAVRDEIAAIFGFENP